MNNIIPTLKYLWLTTKHKAYVFRAGLKTGAPLWRLLIHDLSKYTPMEAPHYGRLFFGDKSDPDGYNQAWLHHQNVNPHHWEYWIPRTGGRCQIGQEPLPMPMWAVQEMVADWCGASKAYEGFYPWEIEFHDWKWFHRHWNEISTPERIHDGTLDHLEHVMYQVFGSEGSNEITRTYVGRYFNAD